jgi:choline dehydrogenase-like flavoprotein
VSDSFEVRSGHRVHGRERLTCDVVVVGSGAGGAPAAYEIAALGFDVLVLEAGPYVKPEEFTQREIDTLKRIYVDQGAQGPADGSISILQGRVLGGSTVINGEVCFPIPERVLDEWAREYGVRGLSARDLEPVFAHVEAMIHATKNEGRFLASSARFDAGLRKLGLEPKPLTRNVKDCKGCSYCFFGCAYGCKQSMDRSYLPAAAAKGARILSDARVTRINVDGGRASGVLATTSEGSLDVRARAVVLACGTIETPLLLLAHGLGGADVGRHLALHPVLFVAAWYDDELLAYKNANFLATYSDVLAKDDVLIEIGTTTPPFTASGVMGFGRAHKELTRDLVRAGGCGAIIRDRGVGRVRRDRKGTEGSKVIDYALDARAKEQVRLAMKRSAEIAFASGARKVAFPTTIPLLFESPDDLRKIDALPLGPADIAFVSYHPQGTARMGTVTDHDGAVRGLRDLYVMDASLFPTPVGVNTQEPVMAVATVLARRLGAKLAGAS